MMRFRAGLGAPIKTTRLRGTDVTAKPLDFRNDRDISGLEVELVKRPFRSPD